MCPEKDNKMTREFILQFHSFVGVIVFLIGALQFLLAKGGRRHVLFGQVYLFGWLLLLLTGAYLGGALITLIGIFGFYFALTGSRIGRLKNKKLARFDKGVILISTLVMAAVLYYSVRLFFNGNTSFGIIFLVFGLLFLLTLQKDIRKYLEIGPPIVNKYGKQDWFFEHLNRMSISFIAAVTAFTSIQDVFGNNTLNFILPTVIGVLLIAFFSKRLAKKMLQPRD